ncbi:hypothetical protein E2C01_016588 [Portunus trituberculatus]|uniref:Uncharacterized protein n=1 Tax=Portunus trituberculatus TaxID=210409 RepID=A0A5B7DR55_PORTR|nr:hypothetical protein [Portunus trituberculatus]
MDWAEFGSGAVALDEFGMGDGTSMAGLGVLRALPLVEVRHWKLHKKDDKAHAMQNTDVLTHAHTKRHLLSPWVGHGEGWREDWLESVSVEIQYQLPVQKRNNS